MDFKAHADQRDTRRDTMPGGAFVSRRVSRLFARAITSLQQIWLRVYLCGKECEDPPLVRTLPQTIFTEYLFTLATLVNVIGLIDCLQIVKKLVSCLEYLSTVLWIFLANEAKMEDEAVSVSDVLHNNGDIEWQPLALTLVEYPKGDWLGKFFALISLSPFGIGAGFVALILFRRDLHTITFFTGTLVNEVLNIILKHIVCEARPLSRGNLYNEYGMPSSHAQFIWFFSTYVLYFVLIRLHHINNNSIISALWRVIIVGGCMFLSLLVCIARVYLHYHTTSQVVVGGIVGFIFATLWFAIVHRVFTPLFPQLVSLKLCEMLMIRDTTLIPNVLWFEYTTSRQEARARGRKMAALKPTQ